MLKKQREEQFVITVVDDNPAVLQLVCRLLRVNGYDVLEARCGADALDAAERHDKPIDLLLTDIDMPGMDGVSLWREVRERWPKTRVVFMSGCAMPDGVDGELFLSKPFKLPELLRIVEDSLDSSHSSRANRGSLKQRESAWPDLAKVGLRPASLSKLRAC